MYMSLGSLVFITFGKETEKISLLNTLNAVFLIFLFIKESWKKVSQCTNAVQKFGIGK